MLDLNKAEIMSFGLVPKNTITKVRIAIKGGNHGDFNLLTKSEKTGKVGLDLIFTVIDGEFANRKFFQCVGIEGVRDTFGNDKWSNYGKSLLRAIVESAKNIHPKDNSPEAQAKRNVKFSDFHDMECIVKIGVQDGDAKYEARNKIANVITPEHRNFKEFLNKPTPKAPERPVSYSNFDYDESPFDEAN